MITDAVNQRKNFDTNESSWDSSPNSVLTIKRDSLDLSLCEDSDAKAVVIAQVIKFWSLSSSCIHTRVVIHTQEPPETTGWKQICRGKNKEKKK